MIQIQENQVSSTTDTTLRRLCAAVLDLLLVLLPALVLAALATERFPILGVDAGRTQFSIADQLRINEIDTGMNRAVRLGDTVFTISGAGLWLTLATIGVLTVLVFFVVPAFHHGQTPGRRLMGLPIKSDEPQEIELLEASPGETEPTETVPEADPVEPAAKTGQDTEPPEQGGDDEAPIPEPAPVQELAEIELETRTDPAEELLEMLRAGLDEEPTTPVSLGHDFGYHGWSDRDITVPPDRSRTNQDDRFDTLTLPESSLSESPLSASTEPTRDEPVMQEPAESQPAESEPAAVPSAPEWSEHWQAWVYRDKASGREFRHDEATNRWLPVE